MLRYLPLFILVLTLGACAPVMPSGESNKIQWHVYRDSEIGVIFEYPYPFTVNEHASGSLLFKDLPADVIFSSLTSDANGTSRTMTIIKTDDSDIVRQLLPQTPSRTFSVNDREWMEIRTKKEAVYVTYQENGILIASVQPPFEDDVMNDVLTSLHLIPPADVWKTYESPFLGISFEHPLYFEMLAEQAQEIEVETGAVIQVKSVTLFPFSYGETASIAFDRTNDERILDSLTYDHPFESQTISGTSLMMYRRDGMGDESGYVFRSNGDIVILSFVFVDDQQTIDRILRTLRIDGKPVVQ